MTRQQKSRGRKAPGGRRPTVQHGTISTYSNHRCRCEACAVAKREYQRSYNRKALARVRLGRPVADTPSLTPRWLGGITLEQLLKWAWGVYDKRIAEGRCA